MKRQRGKRDAKGMRELPIPTYSRSDSYSGDVKATAWKGGSLNGTAVDFLADALARIYQCPFRRFESANVDGEGVFNIRLELIGAKMPVLGTLDEGAGYIVPSSRIDLDVLVGENLDQSRIHTKKEYCIVGVGANVLRPSSVSEATDLRKVAKAAAIDLGVLIGVYVGVHDAIMRGANNEAVHETERRVRDYLQKGDGFDAILNAAWSGDRADPSSR
ncbi:MAG: hypothetical protein ABIA93_07920 [Candidatus Woesearchaeota archaeon]